MKVTEGMICENEAGEVRVWMSENPVNNHPDSKYMSEEQTVANIGVILANKNKELAGQLFGCHTLKDVCDKLNKNMKDMKDNTSLFSGFSHRASESGEIQKKKFDFIEKPPNLSVYRNVFDKQDQSQNNQKQKEFIKTQMIRKSEDECKPSSNISQVQKSDETLLANVQRSAIG